MGTFRNPFSKSKYLALHIKSSLKTQVYRLFFMQEFVAKQEPDKGFRIDELSPEERQNLVGVFAWLIQEDKKQNPDFYKQIKTQKYD